MKKTNYNQTVHLIVIDVFALEKDADSWKYTIKCPLLKTRYNYFTALKGDWSNTENVSQPGII